MSYLTRAVLLFAIALGGTLPPAARAESDPVALLRSRQERLQRLDFAVREAELLSQLCKLRPGSTECLAISPATAAPATGGAVAPSRSKISYRRPRLIGIYGSNDRFRAVLLDAEQLRHEVEPGSRLDATTVVDDIGPDTVTLLRGSVPILLRLGD